MQVALYFKLLFTAINMPSEIESSKDPSSIQAERTIRCSSGWRIGIFDFQYFVLFASHQNCPRHLSKVKELIG
jgi:hypothetical protein